MSNIDKTSFHDVSLEHIFGKLETSSNGLSSEEAAKRLATHGKNSLPSKDSFSWTKLLAKQFNSPLVYILIFSGILSFFMGHRSDAFIIGALVIVTGIISFIQEFKANKALDSLSAMISLKAHVIRDGETILIDQEDIVPGDIIEIRPGDIVPADARIVEEKNLEISEAILTGESNEESKDKGELPTQTPLADRTNMVYKNTFVSDGYGKAVVVATGAGTEVGKIAMMLGDKEDNVTPLQKQVNDFGNWLGLSLIIANITIFTIGIAMGRPYLEMFMISVVVIVSAVPEAMVPAMSIVLALGMQKLIKKQGLVRKIISAETLGSVSIICTDKTGTLTEGNMTVESIATADRITPISHLKRDGRDFKQELLALHIGTISNNSCLENGLLSGNLTERALNAAGSYIGMERSELEKEQPRLAEIPFSSESKIMATIHRKGNGAIIYSKGAPERIIAASARYFDGKSEKVLDEKTLAGIKNNLYNLANSGQRVIAVAFKKAQSKSLSEKDLDGLTFAGLISIKDKIRKDAKKAIRICQEAGIRVAMITGDNENTARAIAKELGITAKDGEILDGSEIESLNDEVLRERVKSAIIYARVEPSHKIRIVSLLQQNGEVVAMTGDGINDAPALNKADIGVVMGSGTDVAKEVADLVLLDSKFMTVVEAVKQGRNTFNSIRKVVVYLFTDCFQEIVIIGSAVIAGWPMPLLPAQILWIKLIESPLPASSLSFEESKEDVLKEKPRPRNTKIISGKIKFNIAFYAIVMDIFAISIFYWYWKTTGDITKTRTIIFVALGMSTLMNIYNVRSLGHSVFRTNPFSNKYLTVATIAGFLLFIIAIYSPTMNSVLDTVPLGGKDWSIISLYAISSLFVFELGKGLLKYKY